MRTFAKKPDFVGSDEDIRHVAFMIAGDFLEGDYKFDCYEGDPNKSLIIFTYLRTACTPEELMWCLDYRRESIRKRRTGNKTYAGYEGDEFLRNFNLVHRYKS